MTIHGETDQEQHESYGKMTIARGTGSEEMTMFGSRVKHRTFIEIQIHSANLSRNVSNDFIREDKTLVVARMSTAQFADAITGLNLGSGTPVTLAFVAGDKKPNRDLPPMTQTREQFNQEHQQSISNALTSLDDLIESLKAKTAGQQKLSNKS